MVLEVPTFVPVNVGTYLGVNVDGQLTADNVRLKLDIALDTTGGNIVTTVESAGTISNTESTLNTLGFARLVIDLVVGRSKKSLKPLLWLITETAAEYLGLALETELLTTSLWRVLTAVKRLTMFGLILDAKIFGTPVFDMPDAGSCLVVRDQPGRLGTLAVAIDDDLINS